MKKIWLTCIFILSAILLLTGCAMLEGLIPLEDLPDVIKPPMTVDVMLQEAEGLTIVGENPVRVKAGSDVSFTVELQDGYKIEGVGQGATYDNGVVTLQAVRFPTTIELYTRTLLQGLEIDIHNNDWQGKITSNVALDAVEEDTEVTLSVEPANNVIFLGYSVGGTWTNGGKIVSSSTDYTFTMKENVELYTNYYLGSGRLIIYNSNGGKQSNQYYVFSDTSPFIGPNALANKGQFTREGYVLYGYNTEPDGSGTYYGPGWSVIMPKDATSMMLYAQWMPVTEKEAFTYTVANNQVTITKYSGTHETVVIPETIDGVPVTRIASQAFVNGKFTTLYLSRNLTTVDKEAFIGCRSLTTLYFCDTPSSITDSSFTNCKELQKLYMLACIDPRYSTSNNGTYKIKYQRLLTAEGKKMIFHAGSNVSYGIDIPTIHTMLDNEYAGVNFGCNQGTPSVFYIEVAVAHMNPGDIVVLCPEYHKYQYGYNEMNTTTWQIFEGAYNAYADVDIRNYIKMFDSFAAFNTNRYKSTAQTYEMYCKSGGEPAVTQFGVYNVNHDGQTTSLVGDIKNYENKGGAGSLKMDLGLVTANYNANLNKAIDMVIAKGGKVYISFASTMKLALTKDSQSAETQAAFKAAVIEAFPKATVISDPGTFVLDKSWFYNSYYHLSTTASKQRAELLANDILAQFAKEK